MRRGEIELVRTYDIPRPTAEHAGNPEKESHSFVFLCGLRDLCGKSSSYFGVVVGAGLSGVPGACGTIGWTMPKGLS